MKFRIASALLGTVMFASSAHAGAVIATSAVPANLAGATSLQCIVTNVSTKALEVTVDIWNATGESVAVTNTATINPGGRVFLSSALVGATTYCRATGLSSKTGRITYVAVDGSGNALALVSAP